MKKKSTIPSFFAFLDWWPLVNRQTVVADFVAGITGAILLLAQGLAFAIIAGLPPEYGLYAGIVPPIIAALFGSSRHLITGPTTAVSLVVFSSISGIAEPGSPDFIRLVLSLTLLAGLFQLLMGFLRLGVLVNFVSHTVVMGFTAGAAILIITKQLGHVFGISVPAGYSFLETWEFVFKHFADTNPYILAVSLSSFFAALIFKKVHSKLPYMLLAIFVGSIVAFMIGGADKGISLIGKIPSHLPFPKLPDVSFSTLSLLAPGALAIALFGLIEAVSISRSIASQTGQVLNGNQEFKGQGLANIIGSFFSCYMSSGSFSRSALNHQSGAKTPLAAIIAGLFVFVIIFFVAPLTAYLPKSTIAAIILIVGWRLIDFKHIKELFLISKSESLVFLVTFFCTLLLHLEYAIYFGIAVSLVICLKNILKSKSKTFSTTILEDYNSIDETSTSKISAVKIKGPAYFGSLNKINKQLKQLKDINSSLCINCDEITYLDLSTANFLIHVATHLQKKGQSLYLVGLKERSKSILDKADTNQILKLYQFESYDAFLKHEKLENTSLSLAK